MRWIWIAAAAGSLGLGGCIVASPPPPGRVVERDVVDQNGVVVERQQYIETDGPAPAPLVEVVPVSPYPTAVWVRGYWVRRPHRWFWVPGHWR